MEKEKLKEFATAFFYWWYNSGGTNTEQGFDTWWELEGKSITTPTNEQKESIN